MSWWMREKLPVYPTQTSRIKPSRSPCRLSPTWARSQLSTKVTLKANSGTQLPPTWILALSNGISECLSPHELKSKRISRSLALRQNLHLVLLRSCFFKSNNSRQMSDQYQYWKYGNHYFANQNWLATFIRKSRWGRVMFMRLSTSRILLLRSGDRKTFPTRSRIVKVPLYRRILWQQCVITTTQIQQFISAMRGADGRPA